MSIDLPEPPHPEVVAYRDEMWAVLAQPERAARRAELERAVGSAETAEEAHAAAGEISHILTEVAEELAPDWPQVRHGGKGQREQ